LRDFLGHPLKVSRNQLASATKEFPSEQQTPEPFNKHGSNNMANDVEPDYGSDASLDTAARAAVDAAIYANDPKSPLQEKHFFPCNDKRIEELLGTSPLSIDEYFVIAREEIPSLQRQPSSSGLAIPRPTAACRNNMMGYGEEGSSAAVARASINSMLWCLLLSTMSPTSDAVHDDVHFIFCAYVALQVTICLIGLDVTPAPGYFPKPQRGHLLKWLKYWSDHVRPDIFSLFGRANEARVNPDRQMIERRMEQAFHKRWRNSYTTLPWTHKNTARRLEGNTRSHSRHLRARTRASSTRAKDGTSLWLRHQTNVIQGTGLTLARALVLILLVFLAQAPRGQQVNTAKPQMERDGHTAIVTWHKKPIGNDKYCRASIRNQTNPALQSLSPPNPTLQHVGVPRGTLAPATPGAASLRQPTCFQRPSRVGRQPHQGAPFTASQGLATRQPNAPATAAKPTTITEACVHFDKQDNS
jgi:hypothetical protein